MQPVAHLCRKGSLRARGSMHKITNPLLNPSIIRIYRDIAYYFSRVFLMKVLMAKKIRYLT
jgi:hypothetical protein